MNEEFVNDEEFLKRLEMVCSDYSGLAGGLYSVIGMVVVGRFLGWRVVRLTSTRALWAKGNKLFGDLKFIMPRETKYTRKSVGLALVDKFHSYWDVVNGKESVPISEKGQLK